MSRVLAGLLVVMLGAPAIAGSVYDANYALSALPIQSVTLEKSFYVRVGTQYASFQNGQEVDTIDYSKPYCWITLNEIAKNGAVINPQSVPVTFAIDRVEPGSYGTMSLFLKGTRSIKSLACAKAEGADRATLGTFQTAFGSNVTLKIHDADVIDPIFE